MSGFFQNLLRDAAGDFFGSVYLRDYQHASKTFRTNSYQNAPKFKFLFHVYFDINPIAFQAFNGGRLGSNVNYTTNFGILVKEIKLPSYKFDTNTYNQYNRKRIIQTKIKYDPIDITFHDDNGDTINSMWQAYYQYYYNDGSKPGVLMAGRQAGPGAGAGYNNRNIYDASNSQDQDWGYNSVSPNGLEFKQPFFKNITVFGFNQHNFTAYTLVNPLITSFQHDKYNYSEGGGTMQNSMTIDYETVVYNYGALDGQSPGDIVTGFGDEATYDRNPSPIANLGSNGTILGQGGLIDAAGGTLDALQRGNPLEAAFIAGTAYNTFKNVNLTTTLQQEVLAGLMSSTTPNPTRNAPFSIPSYGATPSPVNTAGTPPTGALTQAPVITDEPVAGSQYDGSNYTTSFPPPGGFYTNTQRNT
jgi:hypothetical protein